MGDAMGLLSTLNLKPLRHRKGNPAKRGAVSLARSGARVRRGEVRNILEAAIETATDPDSNTLEELDAYVDDTGAKDPRKAVSRMAPRSAYEDIALSKAEPGVKGHILARRSVDVQNTIDDDGREATEFPTTSTVISRGIVPAGAGNGENMYASRDKFRPGLRKAATFKVPESLTMKHEHLHLVIAAHVNARIQQFAERAFGHYSFDNARSVKLKTTLEMLAGEAQRVVRDWLDEHTIPHSASEIEHREAMLDRLLKDGTLEVKVRTALLNVLRKHAKELAEFRK